LRVSVNLHQESEQLSITMRKLDSLMRPLIQVKTLRELQVTGIVSIKVEKIRGSCCVDDRKSVVENRLGPLASRLSGDLDDCSKP
jgi:hypothetical protein